MSDMKEIESRISEIAINGCQGYPGIEDLTAFGALWAIEQTLEGVKLANNDLHIVIAGQKDAIEFKNNELKDLNRLISAWRNIAGRARTEIEAQQITINKLNARCDRDDKLIFQMKDEISELKAKNNDLGQKLVSRRQLIQTASDMLSDAFDHENTEYDVQGVNQAHRVLDGGQPPKKTKLEE